MFLLSAIERYPLNAIIKGAIGFDREVRISKACRVTAYPTTSGTKHNCRLLRVRTSRLVAATSSGLSSRFKSDMVSNSVG